MRRFVLVLLALFILGCADGKNGIDGITGMGGCDYDQIMNSETGFCITNVNYKPPTNGKDGKDKENVEGKECYFKKIGEDSMWVMEWCKDEVHDGHEEHGK